MRFIAGLSGSLLVLALAVTGCGSGDPDKKSKDASSGSSGDKAEGVTVDACALLTPADLETTFGGPFDDGELTHQEETGADQCHWTSADGPEEMTFSIAVVSRAGLGGDLESSGMTVAELFEQAKTAYPNAVAMDLGDQSYAAVSEVQVLDGDRWYSFTAYLGAGADPLDGLKELAAHVVG